MWVFSKVDTDQIKSSKNSKSMAYLLKGVETNSDLKHIDIDGPSPIRFWLVIVQPTFFQCFVHSV
jgi:hypothetical protein